MILLNTKYISTLKNFNNFHLLNIN